MIYLDYAANTPADPRVLTRFVQTEQAYIGNTNSTHEAGQAAKRALTEITEQVKQELRLTAEEVIFTSGASEAANLAIKGLARSRRHVGRHIISTPLEHASVSGSLTALQEQGYEVDLLSVGRDGKIDIEELQDLLRPDTILVAMTAVDSELGTVQPVAEVAELVHRYPNGCLFVDAVQAIGKADVPLTAADMIALAPHKFYGLNGIGILIKKEGLVIEPLIHGGVSASLYRSGTPTLGLAASAEEALRLTMEEDATRRQIVKGHNGRLRSALAQYSLVRINSPAEAVDAILNISVKGVKGETFQQALNERGICVSVKSACSVPGTPSRAVMAVSRDRATALSSFRISLSHLTTEAEIEEFLTVFDALYKTLAEKKS